MRTTAALLLVLLGGCQGQPYYINDGGTDVFDPCDGVCGLGDGGTDATTCCRVCPGDNCTGAWYCAHEWEIEAVAHECVGR